MCICLWQQGCRWAFGAACAVRWRHVHLQGRQPTVAAAALDLNPSRSPGDGKNNACVGGKEKVGQGVGWWVTMEEKAETPPFPSAVRLSFFLKEFPPWPPIQRSQSFYHPWSCFV